MVLISIVTGAYKPTYNGGPHIVGYYRIWILEIWIWNRVWWFITMHILCIIVYLFVYHIDATHSLHEHRSYKIGIKRQVFSRNGRFLRSLLVAGMVKCSNKFKYGVLSNPLAICCSLVQFILKMLNVYIWYIILISSKF